MAMAQNAPSIFQKLQLLQTLNMRPTMAQQIAFGLGYNAANDPKAAGSFVQQLEKALKEAKDAGLSPDARQTVLTAFTQGGLVNAHRLIEKNTAASKSMSDNAKEVAALFEKLNEQDDEALKRLKEELAKLSEAIQEIRAEAQVDQYIEAPKPKATFQLDPMLVAGGIAAGAGVYLSQEAKEKLKDGADTLKKDHDFKQLEALLGQHAAQQDKVAAMGPIDDNHPERLSLKNISSQIQAQLPAVADKLGAMGVATKMTLAHEPAPQTSHQISDQFIAQLANHKDLPVSLQAVLSVISQATAIINNSKAGAPSLNTDHDNANTATLYTLAMSGPQFGASKARGLDDAATTPKMH